jgi:hypothetical protein
MSAAPVLRSIRKFSLEVTSGQRLGEKFFFAKPSVFIGRGPENDLVLDQDSQISRAHVEIRNNGQNYSIHNVSEKNVLMVNGQSVRNAVIEGECRVTVGQTELVFRAEQPLGIVSQFAPLTSLSYPTPISPFPSGGGAKGGSKIFFYVIIVLVLGAAALLGTGVAKKKAPVELRTIEDVEKDVEISTESTTDIEKRMEKEGKNSPQYTISQQQYVRGFRDYQQGQYMRAAQSLSAALSFYPQHELARRYLALAQKKLDMQVKSEMALGQKYRGQGNFRLCAAAYEKVLRMINNDSNDVNYKEAVQYQHECELQQMDHY